VYEHVKSEKYKRKRPDALFRKAWRLRRPLLKDQCKNLVLIRQSSYLAAALMDDVLVGLVIAGSTKAATNSKLCTMPFCIMSATARLQSVQRMLVTTLLLGMPVASSNV
jgi:hypothetical protein